MKSFFPTSIVRNTPDEATQDGALLEAINTRFKDGARRVVGGKVREEDNISHIYNPGSSKVYFHPQSGKYVCAVDRMGNWDIDIWESDSSGGQRLATVVNLGTSAADTKITHMGNFVYVSSFNSTRSWVLYWDDSNSSYVQLEKLQPIKFAAGTVNRKKVPCTVDISGLTTDSDKYNAIIGQFNKIISEQLDIGFFNGHIALRYAYKLFDGSYIMHSEPFYVKGGFVYRDVAGGDINGLMVNYSGSDASIYNDDTSLDTGIVFDQVRLYVEASSVIADFNKWNDLKLIQSVCVFGTSIVKGYSVPGTEVGLIEYFGSKFFPYDIDSVKEIADPQSMFLLKEWTIDEIQSEFVYDIPKLKDIELNTAMESDNFTHHEYIPGCEFNLNNKVHGGNLITVPSYPLGNEFRLYFSSAYDNIVPDSDIANLICDGVVTPGATPSDFTVYCTVDILTDTGLKRKTIGVTDNFYTSTEVVGGITLTNISIILNPVVIYPDMRARRLSYLCRNNSNGYIQELHSIELKPSVYSNYSYHVADTSPFYNYCDFIIKNHELFVRTVSVNTGQIGFNDIILDRNRVQVSRLNNPFVWPAENSYRFGAENNTVVGLITAHEPMTETVFGQYPLNVFTEAGIYALEQGTNGVLYSNVVEVNKEVLSNPDGLYGITGGIVFVAKDGVKILSGRQVINISLDVRGSAQNVLKDDMYLNDILNDTKICNLYSYLSDSFTDYIQEAIIGFSRVFNELILCNPAKNYSYVYALDSKSWHTITDDVFSCFFHDMAYKNGEFYNVESELGSKAYLLQSRPFFLEDAGAKKIEQLLLRRSCSIQSNEYEALMLYGSNDCQNWAPVSKSLIGEGMTAIIKNTSGHYRYFVLIFAGQAENLSIISIDVNYKSRYNNKIR